MVCMFCFFLYSFVIRLMLLFASDKRITRRARIHSQQHSHTSKHNATALAPMHPHHHHHHHHQRGRRSRWSRARPPRALWWRFRWIPQPVRSCRRIHLFTYVFIRFSIFIESVTQLLAIACGHVDNCYSIALSSHFDIPVLTRSSLITTCIN